MLLLLIPASCRRQASVLEESRLSAIVSFLTRTPPIPQWLRSLDSRTFVEACMLFPAEAGEDAIFGIDQEFVEGTAEPVFVKGGDWMGLVGVQRTGMVWVAKGTPQTMQGHPGKDRTWEWIPLGQPLVPGAWYRLRTELDFRTRHYVSFRISGPGLDRSLDLRSFMLDYPNYLPFDRRALTNFCFAIRVRYLMKDPHSQALAYFDDVRAGLAGPAGDLPVFFDGFERGAGPIPRQDVSILNWFVGIRTADYAEGQWYLERDSALCRPLSVPFAHGGSRVAACDATLRKLAYDDWYRAWR